jgi:hypothetical protein
MLGQKSIYETFSHASPLYSVQYLSIRGPGGGGGQGEGWGLKPVPEFIDPRFRENKPKTLVFSHRKRAVWACFRENCVCNFGHRSDSMAVLTALDGFKVAKATNINIPYIQYIQVKTFLIKIKMIQFFEIIF